MKYIYKIIFITLCALIGQSTADSTRHVTGNLTRFYWIYDSCTFSINGEDSPTRVPNNKFCKILQIAYWRGQTVDIEIDERSGNYNYSVNFFGTAFGADEKVDSKIFQYQLYGTVQDVCYRTYNDQCYVAIDTGFDNVWNNIKYHVTSNWKICARAINAFYSKEKVLMLALVNLYDTNAIVDLQLTNCD